MVDTKRGRTAVVALGGNAISPPNKPNTIANQFSQTRQSLNGIISILRKGYRLAITHGNGPQVGNAMIRVEMAKDKAPVLPLGILVAGTQGWMGYMIEQSLLNRLKSEKIEKPVISLVTQVLVDKNDPSLLDPTKFIGQSYSEEEAKKNAEESGWVVKLDKGRNAYRRVVGSPIPIDVLNSDAVKALLDKDCVVICAGGGGVPVCLEEDGSLEGVDAVIDKDRASAVLGNQIGAEELLILTEVDKVSLNFGSDKQRDLDKMSVSEAKTYLSEGHFPAGSMGPKVESAISFLENGGTRVIITNLENVLEAIEGNAGTMITNN